jgi:hypothetical protein
MPGTTALRRFLIAGVVGALIAGTLPAASATPTPPTRDSFQTQATGRVPSNGPTFNDPSAPPGPARTRIIDYVNDLIDQTPRGETIRITQYNLTCPSTVSKLLRAHKRGVFLQIVVNERVLGESVSNRPVYKRFRQLLGKDPGKKRFFVVCKGSCRSKGGALHTKFVSITKIRTSEGPVRNVLATASGNITCGWATDRQYNDQYAIVGRPGLVASFNKVFAELARDKPMRNPFRKHDDGPYTAWFFPMPGGTRTDDPIWQALRSVRCTGAVDAGSNGRTVVRVMMFTWNGLRGMNLARKLYQLDQAGCRVEVIVGAPSAQVVRELRRPGDNGGIRVLDSRKDRDGDGELDLYNHMKVLMISGRMGRNPTNRVVYTGSANWTPLAYTSGDELLLRVRSRAAYRQYSRHFDFMAARSRRLPNQPTTVEPLKPYELLNPVVE